MIIDLKNISYQYPDKTEAVTDICFSVEKGEKLVIAGPNGAGKSTLFLLLNGILKPKQGSYHFENKEIAYCKKELLKLRQQIGIVFQEPDSQIFSASVYEEVSFGPLNLDLPSAEVRKRVEDALKALDIENLKDRPAHLLSYGQKKRVCIASILAMNPKLIIFDEPTSGLDPAHAAEIVLLLNKLHAEGKTIIISTHDMNLAYSWASRIVVLGEGRILGSGTVKEVFDNDGLIAKSGLELPMVLQLFKQLNNCGTTNPASINELAHLINTCK